MAEIEDAAAVLPQEEEEREEGDVKSKVQSSDPAPKNSDQQPQKEDEPHENGITSDGVEGEGAEPQLVAIEEDRDRGEEQQLGPRDEIKVTVTGYQRTADSCTFDVEVH